MTAGGTTTIRVAAVQAQSLPGQIEANLDHAAGLVEQAAAQGASIVALPELFSCGYATVLRPWQTVYGLFRRWQRNGTWRAILTALRGRADAAAVFAENIAAAAGYEQSNRTHLMPR